MIKLQNEKENQQLLGSLELFRGEEHQPFLWRGDRPAALLLHGLLGTPAELRPLAIQLNKAGWTVQGLLLPGFGTQIDTLFMRSWDEWTKATREAIWELEQHHWPIMLVGYSMGAAVALNVAADTSIGGLVLLAPFWKIGTTWQKVIWQVLKRFISQFQPFKKANLDDPQLAEFFTKTIPDLDPQQPDVQKMLRELRVPTRFIDQVLTLGRYAGQAASGIQVPTRIIQGIDDETVKTARTRELLQLFAGPVSYQELSTDHQLVAADSPGFWEMSRSVLEHASRLASLETQQLSVV